MRKYGLSVTPDAAVETDSWEQRMEIPTADEILDKDNGDDDDDDDEDDGNAVDVPVNRVDRPWKSKEDYLRTHYELLREDAIAPLRDAVAAVQASPEMKDNKGVCIYEKVAKSSCVLGLKLILTRSISLDTHSPKEVLLPVWSFQRPALVRRSSGSSPRG